MTYEPSANKDKIRDFVLEYAREQNVTSLADDESVLTTKAIDSLGVFRVIAFMEETFPITIEDTDLLPENFETINLMAAFVGRKLAGDGGDITPAVSPDEAKPVPAMA
ncbi:MAG: acyl carrier protein [Acidobacteriia bacterium]|nr:acyl carrier protein [Terriglobia bacterium]